MKILSLAGIFAMLVGCGASTAAYDLPQSRGGDYIGERANTARSYADEHGVSSEEVGGELRSTDDILGEQSNEARGYFNDRGVSSEQLGYKIGTGDDIAANQYVEAKDHTGEKAQYSRDYVYDRGIEEMRHGDQDTQDTLAEHDSRLESLEDRVSNLEAALDATNHLLSSEVTRLGNADADNLATVRGELASAVSELTAAMTAADSSLSARLASLSNDLQQTAVDLGAAIEAGDTAVETSLRSSLDDLESELESQVDRLDRTDRQLKRKIKREVRKRRSLERKFYRFKRMQQRINRNQRFYNYAALMGFFYLNNKINNLEVSDIDGLETALDNLGDRITDTESDISSLQSDMANLDVSDVDGLQAALDGLQDEIDTIELTPGPQGEQGEQGETGEQGVAGNDGQDGQDGEDGQDGADVTYKYVSSYSCTYVGNSVWARDGSSKITLYSSGSCYGYSKISDIDNRHSTWRSGRMYFFNANNSLGIMETGN